MANRRIVLVYQQVSHFGQAVSGLIKSSSFGNRLMGVAVDSIDSGAWATYGQGWKVQRGGFVYRYVPRQMGCTCNLS